MTLLKDIELDYLTVPFSLSTEYVTDKSLENDQTKSTSILDSIIKINDNEYQIILIYWINGGVLTNIKDDMHYVFKESTGVVKSIDLPESILYEQIKRITDKEIAINHKRYYKLKTVFRVIERPPLDRLEFKEIESVKYLCSKI